MWWGGTAVFRGCKECRSFVYWKLHTTLSVNWSWNVNNIVCRNYFRDNISFNKSRFHDRPSWQSTICVCVCTSATLSSNGSSQWSLHSQWESKKVRTGAVAASAPRTLERIRPEGNIRKEKTRWAANWTVCHETALRYLLLGIKVSLHFLSPSLRSFLNTRTFSIFPSNAPSSAETHTKIKYSTDETHAAFPVIHWISKV